jgi:hypothetical protein
LLGEACEQPIGGLHKGQANYGGLIVSSEIPETPRCRIPPKKVCATFICKHLPENLRCHRTQRQILHPQLFFQLGNDQVEERRTELIELFHKFVRFSDIVELLVRCMLNNYLRKVLANMSLQPIRRGLTDLNAQAERRIIQSLDKVISIWQPYV